MKQAIEQAKIAKNQNEVPVGAIITYKNKIIAKAHNAPISQNDPTAHAEIQALRIAAKTLNNYRLNNCTLYVTLEPCTMCIGAILHARIKHLVYGAKDPKTGAIESVLNIADNKQLNHHLTIQGGIMEKECGDLLKAFFKEKRAS